MKQAFVISYRPIGFMTVACTLLINTDKNCHLGGIIGMSFDS
jgi:hypothetical protein